LFSSIDQLRIEDPTPLGAPRQLITGWRDWASGSFSADRQRLASAGADVYICPKRTINLIFCLNLGTMRRQQ
jgi:hypothetical protein